MNYLSADQIGKSFNERVLFQNLTFGINQGEKVALVGENGSGKSTLLKILAGVESSDSGEVVVNNNVQLAYLSQNPDFHQDLTIQEAVLSANDERTVLVRRYRDLLLHPTTDEEMTRVMVKMEELNAWNFESEVNEMLGLLQMHDLEAPIKTLSGGQKKRVGLAQVLLSQPDLLLLDEPTNHLDIEIIEWLENYLSKQDMALLMVTHDRYFLDAVTSRILELNQKQVFSYQGGYAYFLEKKEERRQQEAAEIDKAKNLFRTELDWIRRQPKARGTKAKYRVEAFDGIAEKAHQKVEKGELKLDVVASRQGKNVIELQHIAKSFGDEQIIEPFTHLFKRGEKIGIIGKNGTGKSTFLKLLSGELKPDAGQVKIGETTKIGYYRQQEPEFKNGLKVIDVVKQFAEVVKLSDGSEITASSLLTRFKFSPKAQHDVVDKLSGGERRRLQLLCVLITAPNFLILDEPTNDLDLDSLRVLESFLADFQGCVLLVTHDRYFLDRIADYLFLFKKGEPIKPFIGNYSDYLTQEEPVAKSENKKEKVNTTPKENKRSNNKLTYNEKREMEIIQDDLQKLSGKKDKLDERLLSGETDHEKLTEWGMELDKIKSTIDELEMRWLELSEKAE